MATKPKNQPAEISSNTTDVEIGMHQHGFSGVTCDIKLFKGEPHEPTQPFFGLNGYQIQIQREKWVTVPVEMADHIESLAYLVREADPEDPENFDKIMWVDKQRFPLQRKD